MTAETTASNVLMHRWLLKKTVVYIAARFLLLAQDSSERKTVPHSYGMAVNLLGQIYQQHLAASSL